MNARPVVASPRIAAEQFGVIQGLGVFFVAAFLFTSYSRLTDMFLANLNIAFTLAVLALAVTVITGGLPRALLSRIGIWLGLFTIWLALAVPFSVWQGGSVQFMIDQWLKSFVLFVIIGGLLRSVRQCRLIMFTIAAATMVIVLMCWFLGTTDRGRIALGNGVLSNPNDLAQLLLMGAPFLLLIALSNSAVPLKRVVVAGCIGGVILITASTGSRGALVALGALILMMLLSLSAGSKLKLVVACVLTAIFVLPLTSADQRRRYLTLFDEGTGEELGELELSAIDSRSQRIDLLGESIVLTVTHPVFGVGPGQYQAATNDIDSAGGRAGRWKESHNAYTQVSSEAGIPALIFYLGALFGCLGTSRALYLEARGRPELVDQANAAYCLWLSLISFAVTSFFSSVAYNIYLPILAGLAVAMKQAVESQAQKADSVARTGHGPVPRLRSYPKPLSPL